MTPEEAYLKCLHENHRISELESVIATDPKFSYLYARDVIKGRFEKGEQIIVTDPYFSFCYARELIGGRFEEGEKSIATDPDFSYRYARDVIKGPFPLCHSIIFKSFYKKDYIDFLKSINYDLNEIGEWLI